ncbi:putative ethanolamine kinase A [Wickerhamiella sorbophila]|uniref:ethanolamine kinase n=1 Tax=Wickerhamiella sorbophila TaxID=45607 RepID=A0A2T0FG84_9ASCO|nr:putative ethanolamine kinase A [Wickerhamiella sorbophila]PRT54012.1 putative ethanolamine kinase A [Wickerhamiella sorbophila]
MICEFPDRVLKLVPEGSGHADVERLIRDVTGDDSAVKITSIKGGITNQLLMAQQGSNKMLVRAFGKGTSTFIDRNREFAVHRQLTTLNLAPKLYCRFGNGLVYGFVEGRATVYPELSHPDIISSVSSRLAQWHALLKIEDVKKLLSPQPLGDLWSLLEDWIKQCPSGVLEMSKAEMAEELEWFRSKYKSSNEGEVMGHCDLLASNILVPNAWDSSSEICTINRNDPSKSMATFIDYEYAMPCPRSFDIANHFQEWQGYDCDRSLVPNPLCDDKNLNDWVDHYIKAIKHFTGTVIGTVDQMIAELAVWWGMPGFYWGIWSAIQSTNSEIDFDYVNYARTRFEEYQIWKKTIYPNLR